MSTLHIAEIPFDDGQVRCRYGRYLAEDGTRWIRHGLFVAYYPDGVIASEGAYEHGKEHGLWRDFHTNGQLAAEGSYEHGVEVGEWKFWDANGAAESEGESKA